MKAGGIATIGRLVYQCGYCVYWAGQLREFHNHQIVRHQSEPGFRCTVCPFRANNTPAVYKHIAKEKLKQGNTLHAGASPSPIHSIPDDRYASHLRRLEVPKGQKCGLIYGHAVFRQSFTFVNPLGHHEESMETSMGNTFAFSVHL